MALLLLTSQPPSPPALNLSQHQGLFRWVRFSCQVPKYWNYSFRICLSNENSELISFRVDRFDLLAAQGTLRRRLKTRKYRAGVL